jgi:hypothetical protein
VPRTKRSAKKVSNELLLADPLLFGTDHDRRAVRVVGTDVDTAVAAQFLKTDPDIGLYVLDQVPDVNRTVGVWQCRGDENLAWDHFGGYRSR